MTAAQIERELPSSPNIKPIDQIPTKEFAVMTGGSTTGRGLGFYGDDFYIEYPDGIMKFVIEEAWDEGPRPLFMFGGTTINLESAYVIDDPNRTRIVRALDTSETGTIYLQVTAIENGKPSYSLTPTTVENIKSLDDKHLTEAALLSWVATRKVLEKEATASYESDVKYDITDDRLINSKREKKEAETRSQEAEAIVMQWLQENPPSTT